LLSVGVVVGTLDVPGFDEALTCSRIWSLRSSTLRTHKSASRTSFDGSVAPFGQPVGPRRGNCCCDSLLAATADDSSSPETRSTEYPSDDTNRKTAIVASIKGRARVGLQVRIFRRVRSLREEGRARDGAAVEVLRRLLVAGRDVELAVGDELVDVEVARELERCGVVTSQMIVFIIAGVGRREKPAFKEIAICVNGLWHTESIAEVEARRNWS
jgi:hypothetical protein